MVRKVTPEFKRECAELIIIHVFGKIRKMAEYFGLIYEVQIKEGVSAIMLMTAEEDLLTNEI